ncbi:MAG: hypothetical protein ACLUSE_05025 [Lacticaseibacillus rhamnosus]|uniref:hypothetical protein n=1 Tax=Lacticaseibacillus rhamnosus TaxID=47715 RepID=UPI0013960CDD|nr:hypothetical protein [Lacticaseibacillus rhamnosus]
MSSIAASGFSKNAHPAQQQGRNKCPWPRLSFLNQSRVLIGANYPQESHRDDEQNAIKENHQFFLLCAK